ncbi:MAG TPA: FAD:protein FMN transferase, partial [Mycobacteriales bacterium]|nr:FAD:protein FMN transferase [Mycobacteriales bacterium]
RAAARLGRARECGVLVSLGGDIGFGGRAPAGGWTVRVQDAPGHPRDVPDGPSDTVTVTGGGLATSSTTARRWYRGGTMLHHLIDPLTSLPARSPWRTVTVHAGSCVDANTASTAALVRGADGAAWLAGRGLPARLVDTHGRVHTVGGWPAPPDRTGDGSADGRGPPGRSARAGRRS